MMMVSREECTVKDNKRYCFQSVVETLIDKNNIVEVEITCEKSVIDYRMVQLFYIVDEFLPRNSRFWYFCIRIHSGNVVACNVLFFKRLFVRSWYHFRTGSLKWSFCLGRSRNSYIWCLSVREASIFWLRPSCTNSRLKSWIILFNIQLILKLNYIRPSRKLEFSFIIIYSSISIDMFPHWQHICHTFLPSNAIGWCGWSNFIPHFMSSNKVQIT